MGVALKWLTLTLVPTDCSPASRCGVRTRIAVCSIRLIMDGVEYMRGASGPKCVIPISGVVTISVSPLAPTFSVSFTAHPPDAAFSGVPLHLVVQMYRTLAHAREECNPCSGPCLAPETRTSVAAQVVQGGGCRWLTPL